MRSTTQPRDRPSGLQILSFQPEPTTTHIARDYHAGGCTTALVRTWLNGDAKQCRLCPAGRCKAYAGVCLVQVRLDVAEADARLFSTVGLRWTSDGVFLRSEDAGLTDLDGVMVADRPAEPFQKHLAEAAGRGPT